MNLERLPETYLVDTDKFSSFLAHYERCLEGEAYRVEGNRCMNSPKGCLEITTHATIVLC